MKQQIDNLIANTLLDEEAVYLPNIGTLILFRHPAKRLSSKKLQTPYREVQLKSNEEGVNIVELISEVANVSEERAKDIYAEWLEQSQRDGATSISTVCNIANGVVFTHSAFEKAINPNGRGVAKISPRTNYLIYIMVSLGLTITLGAVAAFLYFNSTLGNKANEEKTPAPQVETTQQIEEVVTPNAEFIAESTENPKAEEVVAPIEQIVEQTIEQTVEPTVEPIVEQSETPAKESISVPEVEPLPELVAGKSYAVWGVYDKFKNAEKYLLWLSEKHPNIKAKIYHYDSRYMVALCEKSSRSECNKQVAAWKKRYKAFKSVWVYTR